MRSPLRIAVTAVGVLFVLQGLAWIIDPAQAAAGLGMPLLDGLGRSTQVGDFAAFFLVLGGTIVAGSRPGRAGMLRLPAVMFGTAALGRTLAWLLHDAAFATLFIGIELAVAALLVKAASALDA